MLITDGLPMDRWEHAAERINRVKANTFAFFAIGVQDANMDRLKDISVRQPLKLKGLQFREFFVAIQFDEVCIPVDGWRPGSAPEPDRA